MKMLRIAALLVFLCILISNANAFDTAGKFGMGIRCWGIPIITFSNMKFGISNQFELEPSLGYYKWKNKWVYGGGSDESTNSTLLFSATGNINAVKAARSNFQIKLGGLYAKTTSSYLSAGFESKSTTTGYAIIGGIGIEHFVNDNFAINIGALSGLWSSSPDDSDNSFSFTTFGSQLVDFSLVWYLK